MHRLIITFGPRGTFCNRLAEELTSQILLCPTIQAVCQALSKRPSASALLPLENSLSGPVVESLEGMERYGLQVITSFEREIEYVLAGWISPDCAHHLIGQPHAIKQAEKAIQTLCPQAKPCPTPSNGESAIHLLQQRATSLALVSKEAAEIYQLPILFPIETRNNRTRFALIKASQSVV